VLTAFRPKIETAIIQESKPAPPDEIVHLLDQLYVLGVAGGLILQMVAVLQANRGPNYHQTKLKMLPLHTIQSRGSAWATALDYCDDAINALIKLTRIGTA
jgi:hypothetical protein